ncbi:forespore capture DNA-binding protein RefZ [Lentibacillus sp. CBA3610]|uniref:forespore capture DNA-binding protein RefZ n=1 Tax=Lentibacillus sp. CBA3610 TaxID=2518176 RepID=UPI001595196A|nr:forespore capture DNA-binding protein RefZ [Lentibacillus sp. CBA3610]QKY69696.1 TetR/AcrR family transcriptional regulator [Lentibacillus sp. CBA3610]
MKKNPTKQKVIDAASSLFFQNGFHGTSVRDIADKADINVSLISYYFKSKQGLLEYAVTQYYEAYLETIEASLEESESLIPLEQLKEMVDVIIQYKQHNYQLSCFIQRELSLDSVFVREMAVTYLAKENYLISNAFYAIFPEKKRKQQDNQFLLMQLKGMLITPYLLQHEWRSQVVGSSSHDLFVKNYTRTIDNWLNYVVEQNSETTG